MKLHTRLEPGLVLIAPSVTGRDELFQAFARLLSEHGIVPDPAEVIVRLDEREAILSTGIGGGVAVPHAQLSTIDHLVVTASTHPAGLAYPSLDGLPVRLVFCLLGGSQTTADHLAGLARLARLARRGPALEPLVAAADGAAFVRALADLEGDGACIS